jgi:photosystem II stability/assembly factor-like uncharacterized protein
MKKFILVILCFAFIFPYISSSDEEKKDDKDPFNSSTFNGMKMRLIGPALSSGRIIDFAVNPDNHAEFYVAVASGNVFKTTNGGITFEPIFDKYGSYSIGCVTIDPNNPHCIWVGTGENNSQRSVGWGDGIYKSMDGGKSFKHMGLKKSEHIGKIIVDPRCSKVVWVAAQGPLWGPGGDRGLYKSTDGGETWEKSLDISENTGISDIVYDPRNPDVMYASSYQRRRHVWTLINGGPEAAVYKTTDAGKTWNKLTNGLPGGDVGRIGLGISPVDPDYVYALIELPENDGGFYRSTDRGASWTKQYPYQSTSAQYYQEIFCSPHDRDVIYSIDTYTKYTLDGGKTWKRLGLKHRHVDDHALWIDPDDPNHLLIGGDGGIYETYDHGDNWRHTMNLPVTQFYRVTADNSEPFYYVYGGTQDNNTWGGPSQTRNVGGITNEDWFFVVWGDGYEPQIDPVDPNIVYGQWQYGNLVRYDRKSGEFIYIQPQPESGEEIRWNWDTPVIISPHSHTRLYIAANFVFKSDDRGNTWKKVSGDLTRQIDRNKLEIMGKVWSPEAVAKNASTSLYGNIISLAESPLQEGLLYVGTDDGLIQVTEDDGKNWTKYEKFTSVPETTYVSDILPSQHDAATVYATFNNHKNNDFKPYILKSTDKGKTWTSISSNLPDHEPVWTIVEDHVDPNLLFCGTEFGLYVTVDGGKKWIELKSGLPTIAVRDLDIQKRENDLIVGTFGRSIYILDDYTPLRNLSKETLDKDFHMFPIKDALMFNGDQSFNKDDQGETFYRADNPPFGATFQYYMKDVPKTLKQERQEKEKEMREEKKTPPYPSFADLRKEDMQESPHLIFKIFDENDNVVRLLTAPMKKGINRLTWDLRYPDPSPARKNTNVNKASGMAVMPGKYKVAVFQNIDGEVTKLSDPVWFNTKVLDILSLPAKDTKGLADFRAKMSRLQQAVLGATSLVGDLEEKLEVIDNALMTTPISDKTYIRKVRDAEYKLADIKKKLSGDGSISKRNANQPPSIYDRLYYIMIGLWSTSTDVTTTQKEAYDIIAKEFTPVLDDLKKLVEVDIKELEADMDKMRSPWTPGRIPDWKPE